MKTILLDQAEFIVARTKTALKKHGIETINDLFEEFPTRYENYHVSSIKDAKLDETIVYLASILHDCAKLYSKDKLWDILVEAGVLADDNRDIIASAQAMTFYDKDKPRTEFVITPYEEEYEQWRSL